MISPSTFGVVGAGNMGQALIRGALQASLLPPENIVAADLRVDVLDTLRAELGIQVTTDSVALIRQADVVLLAIKPQGFSAFLSQFASEFRAEQLIISVAAGITISVIERSIAAEVAVVRVMPNTPALVGQGMSAFCLGRNASAAHATWTADLLDAVGRTVQVDETAMDAITATSGSGPAYLFYLVEAMQAGAEALGLPPELALQLAKQTVLGASTLLHQSPETPATLRSRVTSRGGTTAAALNVFDQAGMKDTIVQGLRAAADRAAELATTE